MTQAAVKPTRGVHGGPRKPREALPKVTPVAGVGLDPSAVQPGLAPAQSRYAGDQRIVLVERAIASIQPGTARGKRSEAWRLPGEVLRAAAMRYCLEHMTRDVVIRDYSAHLRSARVSVGVLDAWLGKVHRAYLDLCDQELRRRQSAKHPQAEAAAARGDITGILAYLHARLGLRLIAEIEASEGQSLGREDYPLLRAVEAVTDAAKVLAQAGATEVQTQLAALKLKERMAGVLAQTGADGSATKSLEEVRREVAAIIDEFAGLSPRPLGGPEADPAAESGVAA